MENIEKEVEKLIEEATIKAIKQQIDIIITSVANDATKPMYKGSRMYEIGLRINNIRVNLSIVEALLAKLKELEPGNE